MFDTTALGDGPWRPVPMRGPKVLYRSVSVPELLDICRSGTIRGGMNRFNPADRRPLVFFADTLDDRLISQGEHIHRQAYYAAESSQEHLLCEFLRQRIREHGTLILGHLHCDGVNYTEDQADGLPRGESYGRRPGQVRLQDIERIILFKDRRKVASIAEADISKVRPEHRSGLSPAFPCKR